MDKLKEVINKLKGRELFPALNNQAKKYLKVIMEKKLTYKEAQEKSLSVRWEFKPCLSGEQCWCRIVVPETPIMYDDEHGGEEAFDYIIGAGSVSKIFAEHIVEIHNKNLENVQK